MTDPIIYDTYHHMKKKSFGKKENIPFFPNPFPPSFSPPVRVGVKARADISTRNWTFKEIG